ncbi:Sm-like ribonucleoprotein [Poronia punctata]|nr:Sm-like ribonucleoprotein [Poronia punctata]
MDDTITTAAEGRAFLQSMLNRQLRIFVTDGRFYVGTFKCTDPQCNIVLADTFEYRQPPPDKYVKASAAVPSKPDGAEIGEAPMTSRFMGLLVVPGEYIVKMEVDEFINEDIKSVRLKQFCQIDRVVYQVTASQS